MVNGDGSLHKETWKLKEHPVIIAHKAVSVLQVTDEFGAADALLGHSALVGTLLFSEFLQIVSVGVQNVLEALVLLLHFLVVAPALVRSSRPNIVTHAPEDLVRSS